MNYSTKKTYDMKTKNVKVQALDDKNNLQTLPLKNGIFNDVVKLNFSNDLKFKDCKLEKEDSNFSFSSLKFDVKKNTINSKKY